MSSPKPRYGIVPRIRVIMGLVLQSIRTMAALELYFNLFESGPKKLLLHPFQSRISKLFKNSILS